jgi:hypothetical protein
MGQLQHYETNSVREASSKKARGNWKKLSNVFRGINLMKKNIVKTI